MSSLAEIESKLAALIERNEALEHENKILHELVAELRQWRFGKSSERLEPGQLTFLETGMEPPEDAQSSTEEVDSKRRRKKKGAHGRGNLPKGLRRVETVLDVPEDERVCSCCGGPLHLIGEDVTERGDLIPAEMIVQRYRRRKYGCSQGHEVKSANLPDGVIEGGKYEASVYANVVVSKYHDHLPLNRMEGIYMRYGIKLPKQTMWDMLVKVDELVAQPILGQMRKELLTAEILHADETTVALRKEGQKGTRDGWVWGWRGIFESGAPKVLIEFHEGRGGKIPERFLGDWAGTLITDGYGGYSPVCRENGIVRAGCWAHARRPFKQAFDRGSKDAAKMLRLMGRLFALERAIHNRASRLDLDHAGLLELRKVVRNRSSGRLIKKIQELAMEIGSKPSTLPKSKLGKGVGYLSNQREALEVCLSDPRIPIHNNDEERDLRHIVTGRKAWSIFASPRGGEVACRLYSLVLSCIQCGANPEAYIKDVLMAVATTPMSEIASLTPWAWNEARVAELAED